MANGRNGFSRRGFLRATGGAAAGLAGAGLVGRGIGSAPAAAQDEVVIRWWDQFQPLEALHRTIWDRYTEAHPNVMVEYTVYNPSEMGQALQLAYSSQQMPDVHSLAGLGVPVSRLVADGWFTPLPRGEEVRQRLPEGSLLEGFSVFDGQVYSFPLFSFRQYASLNWFNRDLMEGANIDPELGPRTWDEFRQAASTITSGGGGQIFGWIQGIQFTARLANHVDDLAQMAGAAVMGGGGLQPAGGIDPTTGQYSVGSDAYVQALEFLVSLQRDGLLFPASSSLDARTARARWATGAAGMFLDGPWNVGVVQAEFGEFLDKVGVAPVPTPNAAQPGFIHNGPPGGQLWVSSQSRNAAVAEEILLELTTPEYYVGLAERMDQPPLDLTAVERANVHPTYRQAVASFQERVRLAPNPEVRNPAVADVYAEMVAVHPDLGEIAQGVFSGDVTDLRAALTQYAGALSAERERAIGVVQGRGTQVSLDDWVFANWQPDQDYTAESYATPAAAGMPAAAGTPAGSATPATPAAQ